MNGWINRKIYNVKKKENPINEKYIINKSKATERENEKARKKNNWEEKKMIKPNEKKIEEMRMTKMIITTEIQR